MIETLTLYPLSGSHCLPLWAPDCNSVARSIHSLMDKLSIKIEPLYSCFSQ